MQTVQFQCGHCGKLMAVDSDHLGQQVRCPHCQQVVIAPQPEATAPTSFASAPADLLPDLSQTVAQESASAAEADDIFSSAGLNDDLFGSGGAPRLEMPAEPLAPTMVGDDALLPPPSQPPAAPSLPLAPVDGNDGTSVLPSSGSSLWPAGMIAVSSAPSSAAASSTSTAESAVALTQASVRREVKVPWFMLLVFSPLLLYAIVITGAAVLLYRQEQDLQDKYRRRFEIMPDEGDKPGVQKRKQVRLWKYDATLPTLLLPENLCTTLGQALRIGDLEVTPKRIEARRVRVVVGRSRPEPCQGDSLVLYLSIRNLSSEYAFAPLDNYFDRHWHGGARPPFTLLEAGKYRFHGGPADWYPHGDTQNPREWIEGRSDEPEVLQPGERKEMFVCTDGNDPEALRVLFGRAGPAYHGSLLWRVRVRRGLVRFMDKDYSATAVVGVHFRDTDIHTVPAHAQ